MAKKISHVQFAKEQTEYREIQENMKKNIDPTKLEKRTKKFYLDSDEESFVFEKDLVLQLLSQPGAEYLRVYYGSIPSDDIKHGSPTMILSAAVGNSYFDIGTFYVEWPTGLNKNGDPL